MITNLAPPYRLPLFDMLARRLGVDIHLFGAGADQYWSQREVAASIPPTFASRLRRLARIYRFIRGGKYDVIIKCINGRLELPAIYTAAHRTRLPFILWTGLWHHPRSAAHFISYPVVRHIYRHSDAICVYGEHVKAYLEAKGVDRRRLFVVGQASKILEPPSINSPSGVATLLFVGRLVREKGIDYLLEAVRTMRTRPLRVLFVGDGPLESMIRMHQARFALGGTQFVLAGPASGSALSDYYRQASVLVLPSITTRTVREPWGLVVNEAMHARIPVVTTTAVGAAAGGLVEDQISGLVVPEKNAQALAHALDRLLTDRALCLRLVESAAVRIRDYSHERMFEQFKAAILFAAEQGVAA
ncbi:MAG: glycosyltransferase family 4 protein [Candidatus Polarisedimenticolia bacterium]